MENIIRFPSFKSESFVKQSGGHVNIYSEVGHGTTVRIYLPRARDHEDVEIELDTGPQLGGTETVLIVEDDEDVRGTVVEMLAELVAPIRSPELARKARERIPNIAVLFTSGYIENAIVHGGRLDKGVDLLSKPYSKEALARKLRHCLRRQERRS